MIILLDAGHGILTPGKRSPDGLLLEYKYCREIASEVKKKLNNKGFQSELIVSDENDIPLTTRCRLVNDYCNKFGKDNILLVSIHCNAAGIGENWMNARGWSVFVSKNSSNKSKKLAECLFEAASNQGLSLRKYSPTLVYWELNLAICRDTYCPAILTENLFQDNKEDVEFLLSEKGKKAIINLHVLGIINYVNLNKNI